MSSVCFLPVQNCTCFLKLCNVTENCFCIWNTCINKFSREFTFQVGLIFGTYVIQKYPVLHQYSHCNSKWMTVWLAHENVCNRSGSSSSLSQQWFMQQGCHQEMINYMGQMTLWTQYCQKTVLPPPPLVFNVMDDKLTVVMLQHLHSEWYPNLILTALPSICKFFMVFHPFSKN